MVKQGYPTISTHSCKSRVYLHQIKSKQLLYINLYEISGVFKVDRLTSNAQRKCFRMRNFDSTSMVSVRRELMKTHRKIEDLKFNF